MPDPKALTAEQIELLRGLPKSHDERLATPEERGVVGLLPGTPRGTIDLLLATLDAALTAERERVLAGLHVECIWCASTDTHCHKCSTDEALCVTTNPQKDTDQGTKVIAMILNDLAEQVSDLEDENKALKKKILGVEEVIDKYLAGADF